MVERIFIVTELKFTEITEVETYITVVNIDTINILVLWFLCLQFIEDLTVNGYIFINFGLSINTKTGDTFETTVWIGIVVHQVYFHTTDNIES